MNTLSYKTISANKETVKKEWVVVDATDQVVGRLASKVAKLIRGKYKPNFTPHVDCGDNVIIINAAKVVFTGKKETDKVYTRYTGYPGGQRFTTPAQLRTRKDGVEKMLRHAVKGMLPKGPLGRKLLNNLYVYEGTEHQQQAQHPLADAALVAVVELKDLLQKGLIQLAVFLFVQGKSSFLTAFRFLPASPP